MTAEPIRVLVWATYPALRAGLSQLAREGGFEVCELPSLHAELPPDGAGSADVLLADVPTAESADEALRFAARFNLAPVLVLSDGAIATDQRSEIEGPHALLTRATGADVLVAAIRAVDAGLVVSDPAFTAPLPLSMTDRPAAQEPSLLTPRELEVLEWIALGLPNKAIALRLGISEHTVKFHVASVLSKLDARSRAEAVSVAARRGLLTL